ncbi:primase-helicase family protein [uncultured Alcanivorax sp.]|uniref:primase-helicase family protein n=1 Tax=uncultured Alcanivorax sp. TaxID=191215 RepID=UPI0025CEB4CD|nr:primase-helicase family protein [uncultured Alcanivorax sp.]
MTEPWHGDWNDLVAELGKAKVKVLLKEQLAAALQAAANDSGSPAPSDVGSSDSDVAEVPDLDEAFKRFAWTVPEGRIWDTHEKKLLKEKQVRDWLGSDVYKQWKDSDQRRTVKHADVCREASAAQKRGGGELSQALRRYVLLYPSQNAWDRERREVVPLNDLKPMLHRWYSQWLEHPEREVIDREKLVFDPIQQHRPEDGYINMFRGLPLKPVNAPGRCDHIRQLVDHLCNNDPVVFEWLMCWFAYPLQHVGAKMATAVLMHSETQGTGKSLLFERVIKPMYGEYAATLGQHQLESQYTDWRSQKLFGLFEEIFSRDQKYSHTGTLKHMITGETHRIEKKFVSGWEEANHMNAAFLSNEIQPFPVEPTDRRMLVVWPGTKLPESLKQGVLHEVNNGGVEAFYGWLVRRGMQWQDRGQETAAAFDTHREPPMTEAKARLIDFGRPSWDLFHMEWKAGHLAPRYPYETCLVMHLYQVYRQWCSDAGERAMTRERFSNALSGRERRRRDVKYQQGVNERKGTFIQVDEPPGGTAQKEWLGGFADRWAKNLEPAHD